MKLEEYGEMENNSLHIIQFEMHTSMIVQVPISINLLILKIAIDC